MANHPSAEKRHRQSLKKRARNRYTKSTVRSATKRAIEVAASGTETDLKEAAREATKLLSKAGVHGVLHKNNVKRRISRLHRRIAAIRQVSAS